MVELRDGKLYRDNVEIFELTDEEMDGLLTEHYPELPTTRDWSRHQSTPIGIPADMRKFPEKERIPEPEELCEITERVYQIGGTRLLTLYCNKFNIHAAAHELGLPYKTLQRWFLRFRDEKLADGLKPEDFGIVS